MTKILLLAAVVLIAGVSLTRYAKADPTDGTPPASFGGIAPDAMTGGGDGSGL